MKKINRILMDYNYISNRAKHFLFILSDTNVLEIFQRAHTFVVLLSM